MFIFIIQREINAIYFAKNIMLDTIGLWYHKSVNRRYTNMARKMDNPELVQELLDGLWTMKQWEFEMKYNSLSDRDMDIVCSAINRMSKQAEKELTKNCLW